MLTCLYCHLLGVLLGFWFKSQIQWKSSSILTIKIYIQATIWQLHAPCFIQCVYGNPLKWTRWMHSFKRLTYMSREWQVLGKKIWLQVLFTQSILILKYLKRLDLKTRRDPLSAVSFFFSILMNVILSLLKIQELLCPKDTDILYYALFDILYCTLNHMGWTSNDSAIGMYIGLKTEVSSIELPHVAPRGGEDICEHIISLPLSSFIFVKWWSDTQALKHLPLYPEIPILVVLVLTISNKAKYGLLMTSKEEREWNGTSG